MSDGLIDNKEWQQALLSDPRATHELISQALTAMNDDAAWEPVVVLHYRATREVFESARDLCRSECPVERTLGANILGQLGVCDRAYPDEAVQLLLNMLEGEVDEEVLSAVCFALGHQHSPRGIEPLIGLKHHLSNDVRQAVTHGLLGHEDDRAIAALIELSSDPDENVRDWATFGLGSQIETDSPSIRAALLARIDDPDEETRGEAMVGLARRGDRRVVDVLRAALSADQVPILAFEAAGEIKETCLYEPLLSLRSTTMSPYERMKFERAIEACRLGDQLSSTK